MYFKTAVITLHGISLWIPAAFHEYNQKQPTVKRRKFIILSGMGTTALTLPAACLQARVPEYDPLLAEPGLLSLIWETKTMIEIGDLYREQIPEERTEGALVAALLKKGTDENFASREFMGEQVKKDYEQEDIVILEGWILSRTEVRQCALLSLIEAS